MTNRWKAALVITQIIKTTIFTQPSWDIHNRQVKAKILKEVRTQITNLFRCYSLGREKGWILVEEGQLSRAAHYFLNGQS